MEEIKQEEFTDLRGKDTKYPWQEWIDRCLTHDVALVAESGKDFTCSPEAFRTYGHQIARQHGLKLKTSTSKETGNVTILFYRPSDSK